MAIASIARVQPEGHAADQHNGTTIAKRHNDVTFWHFSKHWEGPVTKTRSFLDRVGGQGSETHEIRPKT